MQSEQVGFTAAAATWKWVWASLAGVVASLWIAVPTTVQTLIILMAFDFASGVIVAGIRGELSAKRGTVGLLRKLLILILVSAAHFVMKPLALSFNIGAIAASAFCVTEMISIMENCDRGGLPIPQMLVDAIASAKGLARRDRQALTALNLKHSQETDALRLKQSQDRQD